MLCDVTRWRVHASNSKKHLEVWRAIIQHQRANRQRFYYKRSRFYTMVDPESSEEHWMYIDEYENREVYDRLYKAIEDQPDLPYSDDPRKAIFDRSRLDEKGTLDRTARISSRLEESSFRLS